MPRNHHTGEDIPHSRKVQEFVTTNRAIQDDMAAYIDAKTFLGGDLDGIYTLLKNPNFRNDLTLQKEFDIKIAAVRRRMDGHLLMQLFQEDNLEDLHKQVYGMEERSGMKEITKKVEISMPGIEKEVGYITKELFDKLGAVAEVLKEGISGAKNLPKPVAVLEEGE